jgi:hypothetical protein
MTNHLAETQSKLFTGRIFRTPFERRPPSTLELKRPRFVRGDTFGVLQSGIEIPYTAIKANIAESLNVLVQLDRCPDLRMVPEVIAIAGFDAERETYELQSIYSRNHN